MKIISIIILILLVTAVAYSTEHSPFSFFGDSGLAEGPFKRCANLVINNNDFGWWCERETP